MLFSSVTKDDIIYLGQSSDDDRKANLNTFSRVFPLVSMDIGRKSILTKIGS